MHRARFLVGFRIRFKRYGFQRGATVESAAEGSYRLDSFQRCGKRYAFQFHAAIERISFDFFQLAVLAEINLFKLLAVRKRTVFNCFQRAVIAKRNVSKRLRVIVIAISKRPIMHGGKLTVIRKNHFFHVGFSKHLPFFRKSRSGRNRIFAEIGNVCADFNRGIFGELRFIERLSAHRRQLFGQSQRKFSRCVRLNVIAVFNHVQRRIHKRAVADHRNVGIRPEIYRR